MSPACPSCAEPTLTGASFCEACGAELAPATAAVEVGAGVGCVDCGATADNITDGYCLVCGHKQPGRRDHVEIDLEHVAGVTDKGRRHNQNEDAMSLWATGATVAVVVCDGVSTTDNPALASQAAADAAMAVLIPRINGVAEVEVAVAEIEAAMVDAVAAAQVAVVGVPHETSNEGSPSCTFVAAVLRMDPSGAGDLTVAWLGDSRAYWLGPASRMLTRDHNWAAELVAAGELTADEAAADPRASTITRWLGRDAPEVDPDLVSLHIESPGTLVVCSDGLWNYAPRVDELDELTSPERSPLERARALVDFAKASGGHDNITVVVARADGPPSGTVDEGGA